jgi:hypothetical protein
MIGTAHPLAPQPERDGQNEQPLRSRLLRSDIDMRNGAAVSDDELNPGWFSEEAQRDPAWLEWAQPERISAQIEKLFTVTLPAVPSLPPPPDSDRYSDEMLGWVGDAFNMLFPDADALYEPDNLGLADQFVCYVGTALVERAGGEWFELALEEGTGSVFYDMKFTPAIGYRYGGSPDDITDLLFEAAEEQGGPDFFGVIGARVYLQSIDYADAHGKPHPHHEVRKQHGLA